MVNLCNVDGRVLRENDAVVPVMDRGFLFGDSVYEVFRTRDGVPFAWREHLARLHRSAKGLALAIDATDRELMQAVMDTVAASTEDLATDETPDRYVRLIVTRGTGTSPSLDLEAAPGPCRVVVLVRTAPLGRSGQPVTLQTLEKPRAGDKDPGVKSGNYLAHVLALADARRRGAGDCLFVNPDGNVTETSAANAWFVFDGTVVTPRTGDGLLPGVTRMLLLAALRHAGIPCQERSVTRAAAARADEAFLTGTMRDVSPVTSIDGVALPGGEVTARVAAAWREHCARTIAEDRAALRALTG